jgi:hypothetical protein
MRTRALLVPAIQSASAIWSDQDDETFNRTRAALSDALDELELPLEVAEEDTVRILRLPDSF